MKRILFIIFNTKIIVLKELATRSLLISEPHPHALARPISEFNVYVLFSWLKY
jgi:hypothetical protein